MKTLPIFLLLLSSLTQVNAHNRPDLKGFVRSVDELNEAPKETKSIKLILSNETSEKLLKATALRFQHLESLSIYNLYREGTPAEVRGFANFAQLHKLEYMGDSGPSDEVLVEIAKLKKVDFLRLYFNNN